MRADPADPGGMGSTGPAIEDGVVTLSVRSPRFEQRERRGAPRRAERYVTIARASVPARVIGPPGRVMCVPGPRRAVAGGPHRAAGEDTCRTTWRRVTTSPGRATARRLRAPS